MARAWHLFTHQSLFSSPLPLFSPSLRFNAKRKFRGAVAAVKLMNRLKASGSARLDDPTDGEADIDGSESAKPVVFQPATGNILATNVVGTA